MKKIKVVSIITALLTVASLTGVFAFKLGGKELVRLGTGSRTKAILTVYYCSLYAPQELKGKSANAILDADEPMAVILKIDTKMLSKDDFVKAITEGFAKSKSSGYTTSKVSQFTNLFAKLTFVKYDMVYLQYVPQKGVQASYKSAAGKTEFLGTISGLDFKKALFAIWLGPNPVQKSLKEGMLGK